MFYLPFAASDDSVPPETVSGYATVQIAPLDPCTTPTCDPATGCTGQLLPLDVDCCAGEERLSWPMAHGMLSALAEEIDREPAPRISLDQIWIDRSWSLRTGMREHRAP